MKKFYAIAAVGLLSACASGTPMQESKEASAAIPEGAGRIVVYRQGLFGAAFQPTVKFNGTPKGKCAPRGAFSVDVKPGNHTIEAATEVTKQAMAHVEAGQTTYVRCGIGFGVLLGRPTLEVVPPATGQSESAELAFTGRY